MTTLKRNSSAEVSFLLFIWRSVQMAQSMKTDLKKSMKSFSNKEVSAYDYIYQYYKGDPYKNVIIYLKEEGCQNSDLKKILYEF